MKSHSQVRVPIIPFIIVCYFLQVKIITVTGNNISQQLFSLLFLLDFLLQ